MGERLQQRHGERDVEVERWRERVSQLLERWQAVLAQTDLRQRELEQLGRQLRYYRESADPLAAWLQDARRRQEQAQAGTFASSRDVREQLRQEKVGPGRPGLGRGAEDRADGALLPCAPPGPAGRDRAPRREGGGVPEVCQAIHQCHQGEAVGLGEPGVGTGAELALTAVCAHRTTSSSSSLTRPSWSRWCLLPRSPRSSLGRRA